MDRSTPSAEEYIPGVKKLEGSANYCVWAYRVKQLLKLEEAWSVVERQVPSDPNGSDYRQIEDKKQKARLILTFTLGNSVIGIISNLRDPAEIWARLKSRFEALSKIRLRESSEDYAMLPILSSSPGISDDRQDVSAPASDLSDNSAQPEQIQFQRKKNLAMVILVESVQDNIVPFIMDLDDPAAIWARLKFLFEPPSQRMPRRFTSSAPAAA
ncbi:unnamed protein product [Calypogeia fissa]